MLKEILIGVGVGLIVLAPISFLSSTHKKQIKADTQKQIVSKSVEQKETINSSPSANISVPIVMYHYVGFNPNPGQDKLRDALSITPDQLEQELIKIKTEGMTPIDLDELYRIYKQNAKPPQKPIVLTFDDGYVDFYINAYPLLRKYNLKATQFIITGFVGKSGYLTWNMIKDMQKSGLISFQAHTVNHPILTQIPKDKVFNELLTSKLRLEENLGIPINFIAYPSGLSNEFVQQEASRAGFLGGLTTHQGNATNINFNMPRVRFLP